MNAALPAGPRRWSTSACRASPTTSRGRRHASTHVAWRRRPVATPRSGSTLRGLDRRRARDVDAANAARVRALPRGAALLVGIVRGARRDRPACATGAPHPARRPADRVGATCAGRMQGAIAGAHRLRGLGRTPEEAASARRRRRRWRSSRATTTPRSGRWPASSARRCRCGSSRTPTVGNRAYCNLNEGLGKVLRFGANSPEVSSGCAGWAATVRRR